MEKIPPLAAATAREDVLNVVSHDLRGPLGAIHVALAALAAAEAHPDKQARYLRVIRQSTDRAIRTLQELLDVTQMEDHALVVAPSVVATDLLLARVARDNEAAAEAYGMTLLVIPPSAPLSVRVDPERMAQALSCLVRHSLQQARGRGPIELSATERGASVVLAVRDHGPGLSEELRASPFHRFWESRPRTGGGALSLALARGIAEAHGGTARADNDPEGGARFEILCPNSIVSSTPA